MGRILLVDDEPNMRRILASNLRQDQHEIWEAGGVQEAQRSLAANDFDAVITDQKMPDGEGLAVLASAHENDSTLPVILLTGETGTSKKVVTGTVNRNCPRAYKPFVSVNCAAFTETLLESELFGHE